MRNSTEANNVINNGLDFHHYGEVVIWSENHGTNNRAWEIRKQRNPNIEIITVDLTGATTDQDVIDRFVAKIRPGITRVVTFSEVGWFNKCVTCKIFKYQSVKALSENTLAESGCNSRAQWIVLPEWCARGVQLRVVG